MLLLGNAGGRGDRDSGGRPGMGRGMARSLPPGTVQPGGGASYDSQQEPYEKDMSAQIFEVGRWECMLLY